jgi:hypothetical protein
MLRSSLPSQKSGLRSGVVPSPRADERAYYLSQAKRCTPANAFWMVHPLLLQVHDGSNFIDAAWKDSTLAEASVMDNLKQSPYVALPQPILPSVANMHDSKVYLLDTFSTFYILVGKEVSQETVRELEQDATSNNNDDSSPVGRAIEQLRLFSQVGREPRWLRPTHASVVLVQQQEDAALYQSLLKWMVCDATSHDRDYSDFLCEIHRRIRTQLQK